MIVDELAVGDAEFQRSASPRCSRSPSTCTILFVSHQVFLVRALCSRLIRIEAGTVQADGPTEEVPRATCVRSRQGPGRTSRRDPSFGARLRANRRDPRPRRQRPADDWCSRRFRLQVDRRHGAGPLRLYGLTIGEAGHLLRPAERSVHDRIGDRLSCSVDPLLLRPGRYRLNAALTAPDGTCEDHVEGALVFEVHSGQLEGRPVAAHAGCGSVAMPCSWTRMQ